MSDPNGGIDVDGSGIDMFPGPARQMMARIAQIGSDVTAGWASAVCTISALGFQLGKGPMGREFAQQYKGASDGLATNVDTLNGAVTKLAAAGANAVSQYEKADQQGAHQFQS
jgi:hypothetical protein